MIRPIKNSVLIKPDYTESISLGGIIVPDSIKSRSNRGMIVAVGNGSKEKPMNLPINVLCFHIKGAGTEIEDEGEKYVLMQQQDILAYIEK